MTPIKLLTAVLGTVMVLATTAASADAETYQRYGNRYSNQQHTDQRSGYRHGASRDRVYVVSYRDLRRYAARNGRHSLYGQRFLRWVRSHGRPLRHRTASYQQNNFGYGWYRPRQPRQAYVDLRTGRIWF